MAMNISFTRLTLVEARSLNVTYTVEYSPTPLLKRQSNMKRVPDNASHVVIRGLGPSRSVHYSANYAISGLEISD